MKSYKFKIVFLFIFISNLALAGPYNPIGDDDPLPEPPAPINSWLIYLLLIGITFAFLTFKKRIEAVKN